MSQFVQARQRERGYHAAFYAKHNLGDADTWLSGPAPYALSSFALIPERPRPCALDLGSGIGRHAIPLAARLGAASEVVCVDMLPSAIRKLEANAAMAGVGTNITGVVCDIDVYQPPDDILFDYVLSVSCIEHLPARNRLADLIGRLQRATSQGGVHCFMMATEHSWTDVKTGNPVEPLVELNLAANEAIRLLHQHYRGWRIHDISTKKWEETESVQGRATICASTCVQFVGINQGKE